MKKIPLQNVKQEEVQKNLSDAELLKLLKEEIKKTVDIYTREEEVIISLAMNKAVKNLVQIYHKYL